MNTPPEVEFGDVRLDVPQAAKASGISVSTFEGLVSQRRGPMTLWKSDVQRWARTLKAGTRR